MNLTALLGDNKLQESWHRTEPPAQPSVQGDLRSFPRHQWTCAGDLHVETAVFPDQLRTERGQSPLPTAIVQSRAVSLLRVPSGQTHLAHPKFLHAGNDDILSISRNQDWGRFEKACLLCLGRQLGYCSVCHMKLVFLPQMHSREAWHGQWGGRGSQ